MEDERHHCPVVPVTVGVTGHRQLLESQVEDIESEVRGFFRSLPDFDGALPVRVLSGLAEGADRLVARMALDLGLEVVAVLPFSVDDYRQDFAEPDSVAEFDALLARCRQVVLNPEQGEHSRPGPARDRGYAELGRFISSQSQVLLALWDGEDLPLVGGTSQVVRYHQFGAMAGLDVQRDLLAEDDSDLVCHIQVGRPGQSSDRPVRRCFLVADPQRRAVDEIPPSHRLMMERMAAFNRDRSRHAAAVRANDRVLAAWTPELDADPVLSRIAQLFAVADALAIRFQVRFRRTLQATYALASLMGLSFIAYADLNQEPMIGAFLVLFAVGTVLHFMAGAGQWHRRYLDYRALAEGLRVQFYWQLGGVVGRPRAEYAYDNFLQKQDVEIGWIRNVMTWAATPFEGRTGAAVVPIERVIEAWIGEESGHGQLGYYRSKAEASQRHSRMTARVGALSLWLGMAVAVVLAAAGDSMGETAGNVLVVLMGLLPLLAGVRAAYAHKVAEKELIKQYRYMARLFHRARHRLDRAQTDDERRRVLRALGEAALDEHAEWILMHRERPLEHGPV